MTNDVVHVACQSDSRFAPDCAVMLRSLLLANRELQFVVHFLYATGLNPEDLRKIESVVTDLGAMWNPLRIPEDVVSSFPFVERYGGVTAWLRLLLPRLLPEISRVLYLDADLLVVDSIAELWKTDLEGACLAAVTNPLLREDQERVRRDLGLPDPRRCFNSGVMLLNLERLRSTGRMLEAERFARERAVPMPWADQEPLNAVLWPERVELPPRWNVMSPCFELPWRRLPWSRAEIRDAVEHPAIVHFVGPHKPWHYRSKHPYRAEYFQHLEQTPWRARPIEGRSTRQMLLRALPGRWASRYERAEYEARKAKGRSMRTVRSVLGPLVGRRSRARAVGRCLARATSLAQAPNPLEDLLDAVADSVSPLYFVQVGSNDARHGDPLQRYVHARGWYGVLVEPVPYVFERLRATCSENPRLTLVNAAVGVEDGSRSFYYVAESDDPGLPEWYDQIGSFSLEQVLHPYHAEHVPDLAARVVQSEVRCMTFETLWRLHGLRRLDLLHTDVEGFDHVVLDQIDLARHRPVVVLFESQHLEASVKERQTERLDAFGYTVVDLGPDTIAVRRDAPFAVRLALRRHRPR